MPAFEHVTGVKVRGMSPEQKQQLQDAYNDIYKQRQELGNPITDNDYKNITQDVLSGKYAEQRMINDNDIGLAVSRKTRICFFMFILSGD